MKTTSKSKAEAVEAVTEEVAVETAEEKAPETLMYVGPTKPGIGIQNRVYTEIPVGAQEAIKQHPIIRNLFIPISRYPEAGKQLREQKGNIYSAFKTALEI